MKPLPVIGLGNTLTGDDGVGCMVAGRLAVDPRLPGDAEVICGGADLLRLIEQVEGRRRVIVVDAVQDGGEPGSVAVIGDATDRQEHRSCAPAVFIWWLTWLAPTAGKRPPAALLCHRGRSGMRSGTTLLAVAFSAGSIALASGPLRAADPPPAAEEQASFVEAAREVARNHIRTLPNFGFTETIRRYLASAGKKGRLQETLTVQAGVYDQEEGYQVTEVNGRPASAERSQRGFPHSSGEFGGIVLRAFASSAELRFVRWTDIRARPAAVYSYRVGRLDAPVALQYRDEARGKQLDAVFGLRGEVTIDRETHDVLRIEYAADGVPDSFPMRASGAVDYDYVRLGGHPYLLPVKAVARAMHDGLEDSNEVEFRTCRTVSPVPQFTSDAPPPGP